MGFEGNLLSKSNPQLSIKEITDLYVRKNFDNLSQYFQTQNQFLDYKFFELTFTGAETERLVAHGLGFKPEDIIVTKITGAGAVSFNYSKFTDQYLNITSTDAAKVRFYVGKYWASSGSIDTESDVLTVQATPASYSTSTINNTTTAATFNPPPFSQMFTATGTWTNTYAFQIATGNATVGATYTNNGVTFTIVQTVTAGTVLYGSASAPPLASGTLIKATGGGDASLTFTQFKAPSYIEVDGVGGGGGGGGGGNAPGPGVGNAGGVTSFGTYLSCGGGSGGNTANAPGGVPTVTAPAVLVTKMADASSLGTGWFAAAASAAAGPFGTGGVGGSTPFGGGAGGNANSFGENANANTGAGGGGGGFTSGTVAKYAFSGGGGGAYARIRLASPPTTVAVTIGAGGTGGTAGATGFIGGTGGSGAMAVTNFYQ